MKDEQKLIKKLSEKEKIDIVAIEEMRIAAERQGKKTLEETPDITRVKGKGYFMNKIKDYATWLGRHKTIAGMTATALITGFVLSWPYLTKPLKKEIVEKKQALQKTEAVLSTTTRTLEQKTREASIFEKKTTVMSVDIEKQKKYINELKNYLEEKEKKIKELEAITLTPVEKDYYDSSYGKVDEKIAFYTRLDEENKRIYALSGYGERGEKDRLKYRARVKIAETIKKTTGKISDEQFEEIKKGTLDFRLEDRGLYLGEEKIFLSNNEIEKIFTYFGRTKK